MFSSNRIPMQCRVENARSMDRYWTKCHEEQRNLKGLLDKYVASILEKITNKVVFSDQEWKSIYNFTQYVPGLYIERLQISQYQRTQIFGEALIQGYQFDETLCQKLGKELKEELYEYLNHKVSDNDKIHDLFATAIKPSAHKNSMQEIFWTKRGIFSCNVESGVLKKISESVQTVASNRPK